MSRHILPGILASLLLATPIAAMAQPATPAASAAKPPPDRRVAAIERRITDLRTRLKITPAEQKPFDDFAQVMRDNAVRMDSLVQKRAEAANTGTAVDQMKSYSDMAQAHSEDMQRLTTAFSTLYDALSPDQKKVADQSFRDFARSRRGTMN